MRMKCQLFWSVDRPRSCATGDHALVRMLRKLTVSYVSYGPTEMLYIGASPGGLPASEASPSRHAEREPRAAAGLPPLSPYLRAARIGRGPVRYTPGAPPCPPVMSATRRLCSSGDRGPSLNGVRGSHFISSWG